MLTADELASMRDTLNDSLPDTAILQTRAWVSDGGGGGTTSWTASGTFDCRITPTGIGQGAEQELGNKIHPETEFIVTLPASVSVDNDQQIAIGGGTFTVTEVNEPRSWEISTRVQVKEIE